MNLKTNAIKKENGANEEIWKTALGSSVPLSQPAKQKRYSMYVIIIPLNLPFRSVVLLKQTLTAI